MNFAEILFLLALDPKEGKIKPELDRYLDYALAGALLMDLALQNRIDTDVTCLRQGSSEESRDPLLLRVVNKQPTGDALVDDVLKKLQYKPDPRPTRDWLDYFSKEGKREGKSIRKNVMDHLVAKGVLRIEEKTMLLFFKTHRYFAADPAEIDEVKKRLRELVLDDEIPDPRETVLVALANARGLFGELFSAGELERARPRINTLRKLDLIGQAMFHIIRDVEHSITTEVH